MFNDGVRISDYTVSSGSNWRTGFGRRCGLIRRINIPAFVWRPRKTIKTSAKIPAVSVRAHPEHKTTAFLFQPNFSMNDTNGIPLRHAAITMKSISVQFNKTSPEFWKAVKLHIPALWIMTPSSLLCAYQHFGGIHWLHFQGESKKWRSLLPRNNGTYSQFCNSGLTEMTKLKKKTTPGRRLN